MSRQTQQLVELLELYSGNGKQITDCVHLLGRKANTLKRHAKINGISFPDYRPRN